jgi:beta-phosphoglucomutase-like phosphatase (HAD superfamily)
MTPLSAALAVDVILLDFDGPTCHLFAGRPARDIAADFRAYLEQIGAPVDGADPFDPLALYAAAVTADPGQADAIERWLTDAETVAAGTAEPTPGCRAVLDAARGAGRPVVMVSNNSGAAVRAYLARERLTDHVADVVGRPHAAPDRMKPAPWPIQEAGRRQHVPPGSCVLIGDSVTDIDAATAAGARSIGYANKRGKRERFTDADAVVDDMHAIAEAIGANHVDRSAAP